MWQLTDCTVLALRRNEDDTVSCFCRNAHKSHHIATLWFIIVLAGAMSALSRCSVRFFFFFQFSCRTLIACRWTTSCYRMCVMRRQWLHWRTPLIWFTWKWPNQDQYISMICMPLQTTPAVRIYHLVVFFPHSSVTIHGQPALVTVHIWMFSTRNQFFFSLRYVWWASSVDLGSLFSPQNCYAHTPT